MYNYIQTYQDSDNLWDEVFCDITKRLKAVNYSLLENTFQWKLVSCRKQPITACKPIDCFQCDISFYWKVIML